MEIHLFARLVAKEPQREAVRQAILAVQQPTRAEPGCLAYHAFHSVRDENEFYIHSRWRDRAAFENHVTLPHTVRFTTEMEQLLAIPLHVSLTTPL